MYMRRVRFFGRSSFAAALTQVSNVVSPPPPAAKKTQRGPPAVLPREEVKQEKNNSADVQLNRLNITGFI
jgi:hypothetical protein